MSKNDPHILGKESIGKLLLQYSIPAIIGMTITSIYNIIDSIFIGHGVGAMAIAGLAISFPLMNLVVAFLYIGIGRRINPCLYSIGTKGSERCYGNSVTHAYALYHQFCLLRNIVLYLSR